MTPSNVHSCDVHEGEFGKPGSVIYWNYTMAGKQCVAKELVEVLDEENKLARFKVIEGDILNEFKSLTLVVQVIPKGEIAGVRWTAEFEKMHDQADYPTKVIDFCIAGTKDIEAHHLKQ